MQSKENGVYGDNEKKKLKDFCRSCKKLYIYGAGFFGKRYLSILEEENISIAGFIVTKPEAKEYCGYEVYSVEEIEKGITEEDGVIPAFTSSVSKEIQDKFRYKKPRVVELDHSKILWTEENPFYMYIKKFTNEFAPSAGLDSKASWREILVIRLDVIGDLICTTAFIRELKKNFPDSVITTVIRTQNYDLLKNCPYIDNLVTYDMQGIHENPYDEHELYDEMKRDIQRFAQTKLSKSNFDAVFLPRQLLAGRNAVVEYMLAMYSGAKCRIGHMLNMDYDSVYIYNMVKDYFAVLDFETEAMHETMYQLKMLEKCGCTIYDNKIELWVSKESREFADSVVPPGVSGNSDIYIAVGLIASTETKTWGIDNYKELFSFIHQKYGTRIKFVILGDAKTAETAEGLTEDKEIIINLAGKTSLDETAAVMRNCSMYVGSNTGLLHFASAAGVPSVTIYASLSDAKDFDGNGPVRWGAWGAEGVSLVPPAGLDGCHIFCKMKQSHCINQIKPMQVAEEIEKLLIDLQVACR